MKTILQMLFGLLLGAAAIVTAFSLMLFFKTDPATCFAYLLFFVALLLIPLRREILSRLVVAATLCIGTAFLVLRSNRTEAWGDGGGFNAYSVVWRSAAILLGLWAVLHFASILASRTAKSFRRTAS